MKTKLLVLFSFFCLSYTYAQIERDIIYIIDSLNTQASFHYDNENFEASLKYINKALKLSDSINDDYGKALANLTFGNIYLKMNENTKARVYYNKVLSLSSSIKDPQLMALAYLNRGEIEQKEKIGFEVVKYLYEQALAHANKMSVDDVSNNDKREIQIKASIGLSSIYLDNGHADEALLHLLRAQEYIGSGSNQIVQVSKINYLFGRYYALINAHNKAIHSYQKAIDDLELSEEPNNVINLIISNIYKHYSKSLVAQDKKEEAYEILLLHNLYREKVINEEKIRQSQLAKIRFDDEAYKYSITQANKEKILQKAITKETKRLNNIIIGAVILLLICLVTLFNYYQSKRKLNNILKTKNEFLEVAKLQAEESSKLKSSFISNVSHELRTPLYGVVGLTSLLLKNNDLSDRDHKFLKSLKFSGDYLLNLINDVLQIGKMESAKVELNSTTINLKKLSENILDSFEYQQEEKQNTLHLDFDKSIPKYVLADNVRLSQVLINLIGNSFKFTRKGNIWLGLQVLDKTDENAKIRFSVKDDGPGIPEDKQQIIFDNFSQLNRVHNENYQGTGLGLSIVKNLITLFGSEIHLKSEEGKGAEFSFTIDLKIDAKAIKDAKKAKENKVVLSQSTNNILVVEDNKINQIVTRNILEKDNFNCDVVENGLLAIKAVKQKHYDLVLMDLNMPVMDGFEATTKIRAFNTDIPIVALTAANLEDIKDKTDAHGFSDIIIKPYDNYEFYQKIIKNIYQEEGTAA